MRTGVSRPIATLDTPDVHALIWSPTEPNTIFFGHHNGLLKSIDGGRTWQPTSLTNADAMSLATSPKAPTRMYAAGHGIFRRSDDGGATWTEPVGDLQGADIHGFAQNPADPDRLYALVADRGILTSPDAGATWIPVSSAPSHGALAVSADGQTLLLGTGFSVQESSDHGASWKPSGAELPGNAQVLGLAVDPAGNRIFAATSLGLYQRRGGGTTWEPTPLTGVILTVAISPVQPNSVLVVDDQKRVFRSDDGGATW